MTVGEDIGVRFYLSFKDKITELSAEEQMQINAFMCARLSAFALNAYELQREEIEEIEKLILDQIYDPSEQRAELVSNMAEDEAMGIQNPEDNSMRVGYWSTVCYFFLQTKTHDSKYTAHTFSAYTGAVDDYLFDQSSENLISEEENFAIAYDVIKSMKTPNPQPFIQWAKSAEPGEKLLGFGV